MNFNIKQEAAEELAEIYNLIQTAFETAKVSDGDEQDFAVRLRGSKNYIPQLALVAEHEGRIIGHVMFTETYVAQPDGAQTKVLLAAPLSVLAECRNQGVGSGLMKEGFRRAKALGYTSVFLCGDPAYYGRLGFKPAQDYGIRHESIPDPYVMAYELTPEALRGITGVVSM